MTQNILVSLPVLHKERRYRKSAYLKLLLGKFNEGSQTELTPNSHENSIQNCANIVH